MTNKSSEIGGSVSVRKYYGYYNPLVKRTLKGIPHLENHQIRLLVIPGKEAIAPNGREGVKVYLDPEKPYRYLSKDRYKKHTPSELT